MAPSGGTTITILPCSNWFILVPTKCPGTGSSWSWVSSLSIWLWLATRWSISWIAVSRVGWECSMHSSSYFLSTPLWYMSSKEVLLSLLRIYGYMQTKKQSQGVLHPSANTDRDVDHYLNHQCFWIQWIYQGSSAVRFGEKICCHPCHSRFDYLSCYCDVFDLYSRQNLQRKGEANFWSLISLLFVRISFFLSIFFQRKYFSCICWALTMNFGSYWEWFIFMGILSMALYNYLINEWIIVEISATYSQ